MLPASKLAINATFNRNLLGLSWREHLQLVSQAKIARSIWVPSSRMQAKVLRPRSPYVKRQAMRANFVRVSKFNLVNFYSLETAPLSQVRTFRFIQEIIGENKPYDQTSLYASIMRGAPLTRYLTSDMDPAQMQKLPIGSEAEFQKYYERCLALAESIQQNGLQESEFEIQAICVAIDKGGRFLHLAKGNHRLAIALCLGLDRIPVRVMSIEGTYFRQFLNRRVITPQHLLSAITTSVETAEKGIS